MKLIYGTTNSAKFITMHSALKNLDVELTNLNEMNIILPNIDENGNTPLENARLKAFSFYQLLHEPVFSCDSGLYFQNQNIPENLQPGLNIRRINGKRLNDDEMIEYYSGLAREYGELTAYYKNAVCFVYDEQHIYESTDDSLNSKPFIIIQKPHIKRVSGFPLDSLSVDIESREYYFDKENLSRGYEKINKGFSDFFENCLNKLKVDFYD